MLASRYALLLEVTGKGILGLRAPQPSVCMGNESIRQLGNVAV